MKVETKNLGSNVRYEHALAIQQELLAARIANEIPDTLLLLEHAPVYTIGRSRDRSSLPTESKLPYPLHEISRGGQATFHGPGQLVGYPIVQLKPLGRDLHTYLRALEDSLIAFAQQHGVAAATRREGLTGIWAEERKLASIGVGVKKWVTYHGFALNLRSESLAPFEVITPCGIAGVTMTSLHNEGAQSLTLADSVTSYPSFLEKELTKLEDNHR